MINTQVVLLVTLLFPLDFFAFSFLSLAFSTFKKTKNILSDGKCVKQHTIHNTVIAFIIRIRCNKNGNAKRRTQQGEPVIARADFDFESAATPESRAFASSTVENNN